MKFFSEDNVISAEEARCRSSVGKEDSVHREDIRQVMDSVRSMSFYGYTETVIFSGKSMSPIAKEELVKLGYIVKEVYQTNAYSVNVSYTWTISW